nr:MAG TPA: hypothetical protein [Caudoviricetes sp.]
MQSQDFLQRFLEFSAKNGVKSAQMWRTRNCVKYYNKYRG